MDVLILAGFLGSGKTTLLLRLAHALTASGKLRLAIIENEIGETGIDNQTLESEGLPVREIFSGCICCSLRLDLIHTLMEIERQGHADLVIIEPSGVAGPQQVVDAIQGYGGTIHRRMAAVLVDPLRLSKLEDISLPFIAGSVNAADLVVLNKADAAGEELLEQTRKRLLALRPDCPLMAVSALNGANVETFFEWVEARLSGPGVQQDAPMESAAGAPHSNPLPGATARSAKAEIGFQEAREGASFACQLQEAMAALLERLRKDGCSMAGHVKAVARDPNGGFLLLSATDIDGPITAKGRLAREVKQATVTLNAIVFGLSGVQLAQHLEMFMQDAGG